MFLLARHLFLRRISGRVDEIPHMELPKAEEIRGAYRHWWENHYAIMQETPKRLCMDEYHVTGGGSSIAAQVEADTREGRKWGLEIILASQLLGDFGRLRNLASAVFILNGETQEIRHEAKEIFGFSDAVLDVMTRDLTGPREGRGANFLARYTVSSGERWVLLNHRVGARLLWALTTKRQDRLLRDEMYRRLSTTEALAFLARRFPEGTALPYWQRLVDEISAEPVAVRAANALVAEYLRMGRSDSPIAGLSIPKAVSRLKELHLAQFVRRRRRRRPGPSHDSNPVAHGLGRHRIQHPGPRSGECRPACTHPADAGRPDSGQEVDAQRH